MLFEFDYLAEQKAKLKVIGVGGAGGNAINRMIQTSMSGVDFIAVNTDAQDLENNAATHKIQIGKSLTKGLGAGAKADIGREAIETDKEAVISVLENIDMVFITAGMGGGTGTGAGPVIAQLAREMNILTVGIVTIPFNFEGPKRMNRALNGLVELRKACDTTIAIPNQKLMSIIDKSTTVMEAFKIADATLNQAVKGISDLINVHGLINLDFADVETIMKNMGEAIMGTGIAGGEERAVMAAQQAISSPLLDSANISGAQGVLVNITGGPDLTLIEVDEATSIIFEEAGQDANIIFGAVIDPAMAEEIRVTVIATGFSQPDYIDRGKPSHKKEQPGIKTNNPAYADNFNLPLVSQKRPDQMVPPVVAENKPKFIFEDSGPSLFDKDLEIPAFVRQQHK
ncbi:MAG: cell division protein FtsZ [Candidatus Marinimicrobia bacterium]|nr:cell division protein FtsZ [Candidatus Neomarinimicrobiota bacterium]